MVEIESADGIKKEMDCIGCAIQNGEVESVGGKIAVTENFEVHQDYEIPIDGFMILSSKRHVEGISDFNEKERYELINFLFNIRKAMKEVLRVEHVYLVQEEDSSSHFHIWIFPRLDWMKEFGTGIESVRPIMEHARKNMKTKSNLDQVKDEIKKMREYLAK